MDPVHDRGSMDLVHESGPWTWSKVGVYGPLVHVLSSPSANSLKWREFRQNNSSIILSHHIVFSA